MIGIRNSLTGKQDRIGIASGVGVHGARMVGSVRAIRTAGFGGVSIDTSPCAIGVVRAASVSVAARDAELAPIRVGAWPP